MAANPVQPPKLDDAKEEARLEEQLEYLKDLHLKLRHLRTTVPRIMETLNRLQSQSTPKELYDGFIQGVQTANDEILDFKKSFTGEETRTIFTQVAESRRTNPRGVIPWRARDDPEWTTRKRTHSEMDEKS